MPFDKSRLAKSSQPFSYLFGWTVSAVLVVYFVLGWLTFSLFLLSVIVKTYERQSGRALVEIASAVTPYVLPLGILLLGVLLTGALIASLALKTQVHRLFIGHAKKTLLTLTVLTAVFAALLLLRSIFPIAAGKGTFIWFAGAAFAVIWLAISLFLLASFSLRAQAADFIRLKAELLQESPSLLPVTYVSAAAGSFAVAVALGNALTLAGLVILPLIWIFPNLDFLFGGFLDAHPFLSYLQLASRIEFALSIILIPISFFWFFFANIFASAWIRAMLSAAAYAMYRGGYMTIADSVWTSAGRFRALSAYAYSFFRPLSYAQTRFPIQAIVIQKSSAHEAAENSRIIFKRDLPASTNLIFGGRIWPIILIYTLLNAAGCAFLLIFAVSPRISYLIIFLLASLLLFGLPQIFLWGSSVVFQRALIYGWCLDKEFPEGRTAYFPRSVQAQIHEIHKTELATGSIPQDAAEISRLAKPEQ